MTFNPCNTASEKDKNELASLLSKVTDKDEKDYKLGLFILCICVLIFM